MDTSIFSLFSFLKRRDTELNFAKEKKEEVWELPYYYKRRVPGWVEGGKVEEKTFGFHSRKQKGIGKCSQKKRIRGRGEKQTFFKREVTVMQNDEVLILRLNNKGWTLLWVYGGLLGSWKHEVCTCCNAP